MWSHWWKELAKNHLLVRFDQRGCGLSDWSVDDISFDAWVSDLEAVVDTLVGFKEPVNVSGVVVQPSDVRFSPLSSDLR